MEQVLRAKPLVVLVEDEAIIIKLLEQKLTQSGYEVKIAADGIAGIDAIHQYKPDVVLLDMLLPRLNGFGVLAKLKEEGLLPGLPVIIVSNSGQPIEIDRALELGIRDYLIKVNFDPEEVVTRVAEVLEKQRAEETKPKQVETAQSAATVGSAQSAISGTKESDKEIANPQAGSVLLLEDDFFLSDLLGKKFEQQGYKVYRAFDVPEAKRILEGKNPVDIILLDLVLPGIDGFTFLSELKASLSPWKDIPVIIISNLGQKEEIQRGFDSGAIDYVVKAHNAPEGIVAKVKAFMDKKRK